MIIFYTDGFRNFKNTYIKLENVNFFVGENSTGKTSILSLLNLIQKSSFWNNFDFNSDTINFGGFDNIVSNKSNFFEIGFVTINEEKSRTNLYANYKLKFTEKDGLPFLSEFFLENDVYRVYLNMEKEIIQYNIYKKTYQEKKNKILPIKDNFQNWIESIDKFKNLKEKLPISTKEDGIPFFIILELILSESFKKKKTNKPIEIGSNIIPFVSRDYYNAWIAPIRAKPKEFYPSYKVKSSAEGDHTPFIIKEFLKNNASPKSRKNNKILDTINEFGKDSGLYDRIEVENLGDKKNSPFEIDIIKDDVAYNIATVGYGVSQVFPIIVEMLFRRKNTDFFIQQPEVHLHPKAQAAWGNLLYEVSLNDEKKFYIETHSDFLIDRFRIKQNKNKTAIPSQVLFFESKESRNSVYQIPINEDGSYSNQPESFKEFFIKETMEMLELE